MTVAAAPAAPPATNPTVDLAKLGAQAAEKIERCSAQMLMRYPWWATLYLNLIRVETYEEPTMAVDGTHLFYNPAFTMSLTDKECVGVLMHETAHIALLHCYRRKYREPKRWNIACDQAVNAILAASNITLPADCVPPGPLGTLAEELYEKVTEEEMQKYFGSPSDVLDAGSRAGTSKKQLSEKDWRDTLAGSRGLMPESIARTVQEASEPRKDWKEELARFIHRTCKSNTRTWTRLSRRIAGLPGWDREIESNIVIVLDTSGSITPKILGAFVAECRAITALNGITGVVMSADAKVHQIVQPGEPFPTEWKGGGGTDFRSALTAAEAYEPNCVLYLTDGEGTYPKFSKYPVLWALIKPRAVPFGEKILLEGIEDGK
jgi:predicted metal-dependent peptidase